MAETLCTPEEPSSSVFPVNPDVPDIGPTGYFVPDDREDVCRLKSLQQIPAAERPCTILGLSWGDDVSCIQYMASASSS